MLCRRPQLDSLRRTWRSDSKRDTRRPSASRRVRLPLVLRPTRRRQTRGHSSHASSEAESRRATRKHRTQLSGEPPNVDPLPQQMHLTQETCITPPASPGQPTFAFCSRDASGALLVVDTSISFARSLPRTQSVLWPTYFERKRFRFMERASPAVAKDAKDEGAASIPGLDAWTSLRSVGSSSARAPPTWL